MNYIIPSFKEIEQKSSENTLSTTMDGLVNAKIMVVLPTEIVVQEQQ